MAILQHIVDFVELITLQGIRHAVICPGSRSAAITIAIARNANIKSEVVVDERSAGYIALGMAQELNAPVVLVCTSGTAALNFAPAVAEAFFMKVPLLVLTADRPPEWTHQQDGQTIYQTNLYGNHVLKAFSFPDSVELNEVRWYANRIGNEACLLLKRDEKGPVHVNVPIREPFYPSEGEIVKSVTPLRIVKKTPRTVGLSDEIWERLILEWKQFSRILLVVGQGGYSENLRNALDIIRKAHNVVVVSDIIGNIHGMNGVVYNHDTFVGKMDDREVRPELLLTIGESILSKQLKVYLRNTPLVSHWHIGISDYLIDSLQQLTQKIEVEPGYFLTKLSKCVVLDGNVKKFNNQWLENQGRAFREIVSLECDDVILTDFITTREFYKKLPNEVQLHIGNSMSIRYSNLLTNYLGGKVEVFCNRGTSGIDGCVSTAIGAALSTSKMVYLLVGDVSFLYDRNGLYIENLPANLKIIILNNGGGTIFRMIKGPDMQPELGRYFETRHQFSAKKTAEDCGINYQGIGTTAELDTALKRFVESDKAEILEVFTDPEKSKVEYKGLFS